MKSLRRKWVVAWAGFFLMAATCGAGENCLEAQKVLLVLPPGDFRDEEYAKTRAALEKQGAAVRVVSLTREPIRGMLGAVVEPDCTFEEIRVEEFAAVVFIGGVGAVRYFHDQAVHALAHEAVEQGKVVGAICLAPVILANAGVLQGKATTVYATKREELRKRGAQVKTEDVVVDGKIVTGSGPEAADAFASALVRAICEAREATAESAGR